MYLTLLNHTLKMVIYFYIMFIYLYLGVPKYIKQRLADLKGEIDSNTIIVGDFNTHLHQWIDYPDGKSIRKHWPQ